MEIIFLGGIFLSENYLNKLISYIFFYCSSLLLISISFCNANTYKETIHLNNGTIIKGEIIKKTEDGTITVQSGDNTFTFSYDDVLRIEKTSQKNIETARTYLEETRKRIKSEKINYKNFYYMARLGIAFDDDTIDSHSYTASVLGFYWPINDKILIGINGSVTEEQLFIDPVSTMTGYSRTTRYMYGFSYLQFVDEIGKGFYWRADSGLTGWERNNAAGHLGFGILLGGGYAWNISSAKILLELDYHVHRYGGGDGPDAYNIRWGTITVGGLF